MTILKIECMYCHKNMGQKDGEGVEGTSHSICRECWEKYYPSGDTRRRKMNKKRIFATLHLARTLTTTDKIPKRLILSAFHYGYTVGWEAKK